MFPLYYDPNDSHMESPGYWECPGLYCCSSHYYFCCFHKPHVPGVTAAPGLCNSVMPTSFLHRRSLKLPSLWTGTNYQLCTASLTCSPQSQMPLVSLYWQCKSENMKTDCLVAKKDSGPPWHWRNSPSPSRSLWSYFTNYSSMAIGKSLLGNKAVSKKAFPLK